MVKWQVLKDGEIIEPPKKLPNLCDEIRLLDGDSIKAVIKGRGQPRFFIRHFFDFGFKNHRLEYHICLHPIELAYDPLIDLVSCYDIRK